MRIASTVGTIAGSGGTPTQFDFYIGPNALPINDPLDPTTNPSGTGTNQGTQASPWSISAINNQTCRHTTRGGYQGKRVGFLDGIYSLYSYITANAGALIYYNIEGGSAGSPTVISAVNTRKAILDCHQIPGSFGSGYALGAGGVLGQSNAQSPFISHPQGYVEIHGLVITGLGYNAATPDSKIIAGVYLSGVATAPGLNPGWVVQDCEFSDFLFYSGTPNHPNSGCIWMKSALNAVIRNNLMHDFTTAGAGGVGSGSAGVQNFWCYGTLVEYNTIYNCVGTAIYMKDAQNNNPIVRYNHVESAGTALEEMTAGDVGTTLNVYNNILVEQPFGAGTASEFWEAISTGAGTVNGINFAQGSVASLNFYNNTLYSNSTNTFQGLHLTGMRGNLVNPAGTVSQWNNIWASTAGWRAFGLQYLAVGPGCIGVFDYNYYQVSNINTGGPFSTWPASSLTPTNFTSNSAAAWQGLGFDLHSAMDAGATALFVSPGVVNSPTGYKLASGSPASNFGKVGGVTAGASCDAGAWGGASPPTTIGASFLSTKLSLAADPFPRTYWQVIAPGSGASYADATFQANAAKFNIINTGPYMGIEQGMGQTFATIFANIKSLSKLPTPTRCLHYTISSEQSTVGGGGSASTYTVWSNTVNTANWWTRATYPGGAIVTYDANSGLLAINSQNTVLSGGNTIYQAFWNHYDGVLRQGNAVSQGYAANLAFAPNIYLDGYQMDNVFAQPRRTADWAMNGTSTNPNWPNTDGAPTADAWIQQGQAQQVAAIRTLNPAAIILGNCDYYGRSTTNYSYKVTLDPSQNGLFDIVYCQNVIGAPSGIEGTGGAPTTAQIMSNLILAENQMNANGSLIIEQCGRGPGATAWTNANQASWGNTDWQAARYGLALACLRNWYYAFNNQENYLPLTTPYFMDEFVQRGIPGWLGQSYAADPPQSVPRTANIWFRRFAPTQGYPGGVVFMNPIGNGVQTVTLSTLGLTGLSAIANVGYGDPTINTGLPVTSITMQGRDARFLIY